VLLWYFTNAAFFNSWFPFNGIKLFLLRIFGAKVGTGVIIKPRVNIKYPWKLSVGNYCWIGEGVWIDNLEQVVLEDHVCISQGAVIMCGNHNYKKKHFDLMVNPVHISRGAWVGAFSMLAPGINVGEHAVLQARSFATKNLDANGIYAGNPAVKTGERVIDP
jgi:putative colanic acid biosynthesis acetyltransferase WcaF